MAIEILYQVKAQRGKTLRCKGWKQESLLRMLENNMENAEKPERLGKLSCHREIAQRA